MEKPKGLEKVYEWMEKISKEENDLSTEERAKKSRGGKIFIEIFVGLTIFIVFSDIFGIPLRFLSLALIKGKQLTEAVEVSLGVLVLVIRFLFAGIATYKIMKIFHKHFEL